MRTEQAGEQFRGGNMEGGDQGYHVGCPLEGGRIIGWTPCDIENRQRGLYSVGSQRMK